MIKNLAAAGSEPVLNDVELSVDQCIGVILSYATPKVSEVPGSDRQSN